MGERVEDFIKEKRGLISDFNEAKLQIFRLNNSWERFGSAIRSGRLEDANWELDDIFGELSTDAEEQDKNEDEKETYKYKINKLNGLIAKHKQDAAKLYEILRMKEKILRRLQDVSGKGSKRSYGDEDDIEG